MRLAERTVVALVALAAAGWLGLGLHSSRLEAEGRAAAKAAARAPDARAGEARRLLTRSRRHNADASPLLLEAGLLNAIGRPRDALPLAREAVRREPENLEAWLLLERAARGEDPALARRARARALELNPRGFGR